MAESTDSLTHLNNFSTELNAIYEMESSLQRSTNNCVAGNSLYEYQTSHQLTDDQNNINIGSSIQSSNDVLENLAENVQQISRNIEDKLTANTNDNWNEQIRNYEHNVDESLLPPQTAASECVENNFATSMFLPSAEERDTTEVQSELTNIDQADNLPNESNIEGPAPEKDETKEVENKVEGECAENQDTEKLPVNNEFEDEHQEEAGNYIEFSSIEQQFLEDSAINSDQLEQPSENLDIDVLKFEVKSENAEQLNEEVDEIIGESKIKLQKKRRRILVQNDSDDEQNTAADVNSNTGYFEDGPADDNESVEADLEIVENDKPGPKSKKASTQLQKVLQARALIQSAVFIPAAGDLNNKRKNRIVDSDEEEEVSEQHIDAAGNTDNDDSTEDEPPERVRTKPKRTKRKVKKPTAKNRNTQSDYIELHKIVKIVPFEKTMYFNDLVKEEDEVKRKIAIKLERNNDGSKSTPTKIKMEPSGATMSASKIKKEQLEQKPNTNVRKPPSKGLPFGGSDDEDDEHIPNEIYFGTPDSVANRGRGRQTETAATSKPFQYNIKTESKPSHGTFLYKPTSSLSAEKSWPNSQQRTPAAGLKPKSVIRQQRLLQYKKDQINEQKMKKIPNDIYFGEVDVPLHVLHSYGSDNSSGDDGGVKRVKTTPAPSQQRTSAAQQKSPRPIVIKTYQPAKPHIKTEPIRRPTADGKDNSKGLILTMQKFLKAAGMKKVNLDKLWKGCNSNQERANKMLELLRKHGLQGEPTIAKCRQIRNEMAAKREIQELDTTLILPTEGRTRRSARNATTQRPNYAYDDDEVVQETITKLKKVVDSDSDVD